MKKRARFRHQQPRGIQIAYYGEIRKVLAFAHALVKKRLLSKTPDLIARASEHRHDALPAGKRVNHLAESLKKALWKAFPQKRLEAIATRTARSTDTFVKKQFDRHMTQLVGLPMGGVVKGLEARMKQFTADNVALIRNVGNQFLDQTEALTLAAVREGDRHEDLAKEIQRRLGVAQSRAQLIARDQVLKFSGSLNKVRQQAVGIEKYIWRTAQDTRVREDHAEREGEVYAWDDPPGDEDDPATGGNPGVAINCRCYGEPLIEEDAPDVEEETSAEE